MQFGVSMQILNASSGEYQFNTLSGHWHNKSYE